MLLIEAAESRWEVWDDQCDKVQAGLVDLTHVQSHFATILTVAGEQAILAGEMDRATRAAGLADVLWRRLDATPDPDEVRRLLSALVA